MKTNTQRVLSRTGARELSPEQVERVKGGIHTNTACTFDATTQHPDGDVGECG
jgi:hypothetical protein